LGERDVDATFRFFDLFNITCSVNAYRLPGTEYYFRSEENGAEIQRHVLSAMRVVRCSTFILISGISQSLGLYKQDVSSKIAKLQEIRTKGEPIVARTMQRMSLLHECSGRLEYWVRNV
jgi:hypothetical protein